MDDSNEDLAKFVWRHRGCPEFPPAQKIFRDRGENYFVSILMPGGDVDEIRRSMADPLIEGAIPAYFMADVIDFIWELITTPRKGPEGQVVITREPKNGGGDVWDVVYITDMIPVKKNQLGKHMCAILNDWANYRDMF